jgi:D-glycero-D-manno-heptose 1,7-bisphosphate phosphatase
MASLHQCAILVGGLGTRLGSLTAEMPKPLLDVAGRPFLGWIVRELSRFGIDEIVLLSGHLSDQILAQSDSLQRSLPKPVRVRFSPEPIRAGTGGALWQAREQLDDRFLLVNGDSWFDTNIARFLVSSANVTESIAHVLLRETDDPSRYGVVRLSGNRILTFDERLTTKARSPSIMNAGIYLLSKDILKFTEPNCSLERDVFPKLARQGLLTGKISSGYFIDIGTPTDYARAAFELPKRLYRPAVFFDAGVLNERVGSRDQRDHFLSNEHAPEAIRAASDAGYHAFVVVSGRRPSSKEDIEDYLRSMMSGRGGTVDDMRYVALTQHAEAKHDCEEELQDRASAAIADLSSKWNINVPQSFVVHHDKSRAEVPTTSGMATQFFSGGDIGKFVSQFFSSASELNR